MFNFAVLCSVLLSPMDLFVSFLLYIIVNLDINSFETFEE